MTFITFHAYPELINDRGALADTQWEGRTGSAADAVAATIKHDPEAIVLRVSEDLGNGGFRTHCAVAHRPGGLG